MILWTDSHLRELRGNPCRAIFGSTPDSRRRQLPPDWESACDSDFWLAHGRGIVHSLFLRDGCTQYWDAEAFACLWTPPLSLTPSYPGL